MSEVYTLLRRDIRLHGKTPRVDHKTRSYPILVRDGIMDRVRVLPYFAGFHFSTNKALQIQPQSLPFCGVYFIQEIGAVDGEAQVGEPRFRTSARYGFSVIILNNDPDAGDYKLDEAMQALAHGLFDDPTLYNNSVFKIQGYTSTSRQHIFGNTGQNNELPIAELRFELICDLGVITYPPQITDDFEILHVETDFPVGGDSDAVEQVVVEYDVQQD